MFEGIQNSLNATEQATELFENNAVEVAKLYKSLTKAEDPKSIAVRLFGTKKVPTKTYFPETTQIIPEPRTNSLIILGDRESIEKIENLITSLFNKNFEPIILLTNNEINECAKQGHPDSYHKLQLV